MKYNIKKINELIKKKIFCKIILKLIFCIFILLIELKRVKDLTGIKVCICTVGKKENRYIKEFVEYYKNIGINKIFLYDNNDINGENFENILSEYINQNYVEIKNWRGIKSPQMPIYQNCYKDNYYKFDWIIFNDIDEFLYLKNYNNIKAFLNKPKFKNCDNIQLNWLIYTDNNLLFYQNSSVIKRFTEKVPKSRIIPIEKYSNGKSILKGHIPNIKISNFHCISNEIKSCNGYGNKLNFKYPDYKNYYFKHYYFKSTEEFVEKVKKGDVYHISDKFKITQYFRYNKITYEKYTYIERNLGINLTSMFNKSFNELTTISQI